MADYGRDKLGTDQVHLGSGTLTQAEKEQRFQEYLEQERVAVAAGRPAPFTAAWPIERRRALFMRRYGLSATTTHGSPVTAGDTVQIERATL